MKRLYSILIGLGFALAAAPAHALFEARLTYTVLASNPDLASLYTGASSDVPSAAANYGMGADVIVFPPLFGGWGFGGRMENLAMTATSGDMEYKSNAQRTSLLVTYRFIDTLLHLGLVGTYGIGHTNSMKVTKTSPAVNSEWEPGSTSSYQLGVDVGAGLAGFVFGGEAGMENMKWKDSADKNNAAASKKDIDMSGTYVKFYVGFGI